MADDNAARLGMRLKPGRQVHLIAYNSIVHAVLAAKIADGAIARVDANPHLERLLQPGIAPFRLEFLDSPLHRDGHVNASQGVLMDSLSFGIAEKRQDRVTNVLVDGRTMSYRNLRHFRQVVIEQTG